MNLQSLSNLFATTYNADPNVRLSAELQIRKVSTHPGHVHQCLTVVTVQIGGQEGMVAALLQIVAADTVDLYVSNASKQHNCAFNELIYDLSTGQLANPAQSTLKIACHRPISSSIPPDNAPTRQPSLSPIGMH